MSTTKRKDNEEPDLSDFDHSDLYKLKRFKTEFELKIGRGEVPTPAEFKLACDIHDHNLLHLPPPPKPCVPKPVEEPETIPQRPEVVSPRLEIDLTSSETDFRPDEQEGYYPVNYSTVEPYSCRQEGDVSPACYASSATAKPVTSSFYWEMPDKIIIKRFNATTGAGSATSTSYKSTTAQWIANPPENKGSGKLTQTQLVPVVSGQSTLRELRALRPPLPPVPVFRPETTDVPLLEPASVSVDEKVLIPTPTPAKASGHEKENKQQQKDHSQQEVEPEFADPAALNVSHHWGSVTIRKRLMKGLNSWYDAKDASKSKMNEDMYQWCKATLYDMVLTKSFYNMIRTEDEDEPIDVIQLLEQQAALRSLFPRIGLTSTRTKDIIDMTKKNMSLFKDCTTVEQVYHALAPLVISLVDKAKGFSGPKVPAQEQEVPSWLKVPVGSLMRVVCEFLKVGDLSKFRLVPTPDGAPDWYCQEVHSIFMRQLLYADKPHRPDAKCPLRLICDECLKDDVNPGMFNASDLTVVHIQCLQKHIHKLPAEDTFMYYVFYRNYNPAVL